MTDVVGLLLHAPRHKPCLGQPVGQGRLKSSGNLIPYSNRLNLVHMVVLICAPIEFHSLGAIVSIA